MSTNRFAYYNDSDPFICAWVRELIKAGLVPDGEVDGRSIADVQPGEVKGFAQVHWFCGILGWPLALQLAGWNPARSVWTGSCPCPSFSTAGKRKGFDDPRGQLWVEMFRLIRECRPERVFGEQVDGAIGHGWLDRVSDDLEAEGYAVGAAVLPAFCVGAPHIRQRLFWVADAERTQRRAATGRGDHQQHGAERQGQATSGPGDGCGTGGLADATGGGRRERGDAPRPGSGGHTEQPGGAGCGFWSDSRLVACRDGKLRRVPLEPALFPLSSRLPGRVGILRGAGNSIVPQLAAAFIRAAEGELT